MWATTIIENILKELKEINDEYAKAGQEEGIVSLWKFIGARAPPPPPFPSGRRFELLSPLPPGSLPAPMPCGSDVSPPAKNGRGDAVGDVLLLGQGEGRCANLARAATGQPLGCHCVITEDEDGSLA